MEGTKMVRRGMRRRYTAAEKVAILKRHLVEKEAVSGICGELKLHPNQFYDWQRQFFENGVKAFEADEKKVESKLKAQVEVLQEKLQRKDSVLSELMEEHITLKKNIGEI
jgi:transposase-like protein